MSGLNENGFYCNNDGFAYPWEFAGVKVWRDFDGNMWERLRKEGEGDDEEAGAWMGNYDAMTGALDVSAPEPEFKDAFIRNCENDGMVRPWTFRGVRVFRDFDGNMWEYISSSTPGTWMGKYNAYSETLDVYAPEPAYECEGEGEGEVSHAREGESSAAG